MGWSGGDSKDNALNEDAHCCKEDIGDNVILLSLFKQSIKKNLFYSQTDVSPYPTSSRMCVRVCIK